jgi:hypothetical protein
VDEQRSYEEAMAERDTHPLGKPKPYRPGHINWLAAPPPGARPAIGIGTGAWKPTWGRTLLLLLAMLLACHGAHGALTHAGTRGG